MYILYFDSGTTNTRAYLLREGVLIKQKNKQIGAKDSALEKDNSRLIQELYKMYIEIADECGISTDDIEHIYLSGMISSPSGLIEIEHLSTPVDKTKLRNQIYKYKEDRCFSRILEIVPGIKTIERGKNVGIEDIAKVDMMRGEEIEIFGILSDHKELMKGKKVILMPGSHTQAVFVTDGVITNISSNIAGELFSAIVKGTILGASVSGNEDWVIDHKMVALGGEHVHQYGFDRALYRIRILDLFTDASLNQRRSYLEGVLNVGIMDDIVRTFDRELRDADSEKIQIAILGDKIQQEVFQAFFELLYTKFELYIIEQKQNIPYSVRGILALTQ